VRSFRRTLIAATVVVGCVACGIERPSFGFGEPSDAESGDSVAEIVTSAGADATPAGEAAIPRDSVGAAPTRLEEADSLPDTLDDGVSQVEVPEPAEVAANASLDVRLDRLIAAQEALNRRFDSMAVAGGPSTTGTVQEGGRSETATASSDSVGSPGRPGEARQLVRNFGLAVVWSIVVIAIVNLLVRGLVWLLDTLAERNARRRLTYKRLVPIIRIVLWVFTAYFIVRVIFQVDAQGVVAAAAAVGVAVGFAAQDLLKNLFGGFILVFDQPFQAGDKISIGGTYGEVVSIGLRSTRIVTPDDNLVTVPNAQMVDQQVANANAGELNCQVVTDLYLPGWADEAEAKRIAFEAASGSRYVFLKKPIVVLVSDVFKETFLTRVRVKAYVLDPRLEFLLQSDVTERARAGFREAGLLRMDHMRWDLVYRTGVVAAAEADEHRAAVPSDRAEDPVGGGMDEGVSGGPDVG
jgi:small-conductance mechanosensitive channel